MHVIDKNAIYHQQQLIKISDVCQMHLFCRRFTHRIIFHISYPRQNTCTDISSVDIGKVTTTVLTVLQVFSMRRRSNYCWLPFLSLQCIFILSTGSAAHGLPVGYLCVANSPLKPLYG